MTKAERTRVEAATVQLPDMGGQGVLVPGGFILTATHCIEWSGTGGMAMGDHCLESVETRSGQRFKVGPWAADPVTDMAVLGELDNQVFYDECEAFEAWREQTRPVPLSARPRLQGSCVVHVRTHRGGWLTGRGRRVGFMPRGTMFLEIVGGRIEGGTSGGPVVDDAGRLVGVVSHAAETSGATQPGMIPVARLALPRWILEQIARARR